jgi:hypothetical protein
MSALMLTSSPTDSESESTADVHPLVAAHGRVHTLLEEQLLTALERLTLRDFTGAQLAWRAFSTLLRAHMVLEDAAVLPAYAPLATAGAARLDHIEGDHTILERHTAMGDALFPAVDDVMSQRDVVLALPPMLRLHSTLEHHTLREQTHVYPALAHALPSADVHALINALNALVDDSLHF